jgi:BMFP domain-containing protein YqiC
MLMRGDIQKLNDQINPVFKNAFDQIAALEKRIEALEKKLEEKQAPAPKAKAEAPAKAA